MNVPDVDVVIVDDDKNKYMRWRILFGALGVLLLLTCIVFVKLYLDYRRAYGEVCISPGQEYRVHNRTYQLPNLPMNVPSVRILKEAYLERSHSLLHEVTDMLTEMNIPSWPADGTLLGLARHGTLIPWDDDVDVHTLFWFKDQIFSNGFLDQCRKRNLVCSRRTCRTPAHDRTRACCKHCSMMHVRFEGTVTPVLDILFVFRYYNELRMVLEWDPNGLRFDKKEHWPYTAIFPLNSETVDGLTLSMPQDPVKVSKDQFGEGCMQSMHVAPWYRTHQICYHNRSYTDLVSFPED